MYRPFFIIVLLCSLFPTLQTKAQLSNTGLLLYLPLDGNALDASGNGYNGFAQNITPVSDVDGNAGKALRFGTDGRILIDNPALLRGEHEELTILVKVYFDDLYDYTSFFSWHYLQMPSNTEKEHLSFFGYYRMTTRPPPYHPEWGIYNGYWDNYCSPDMADPDKYFFQRDSTRMIGQWFSLAFVLNKGNLKQYYNCRKVYDKNISIGRLKPCETDSANPMKIYLGNWSINPGVKFTGMIDELRIYKRVLGEDEIKAYAGNLCDKKEIEPFVSIAKNPCYNNRFRVSDASVTYNIPVVSRKWTIARDGLALNDSIGFDHTFTRFGNYTVKLTLIDIDGFRYIKDTTFMVSDVSEKHFLSTERDLIYLCGGQRSVNVNIAGGTSYQWSPCVDLSVCIAGSVTITPQTDQVYTVAARNAAGCTDTLYLTVKKGNDSSDVYIPTVFSPNNDGLNDAFRIHQSVLPAGFLLEVYNRWGRLVFKTTDPRVAWNGGLNGIPQPSGMYVWQLKYNGGEGCPDTKKKGIVMLVR